MTQYVWFVERVSSTKDTFIHKDFVQHFLASNAFKQKSFSVKEHQLSIHFTETQADAVYVKFFHMKNYVNV